MGIQRLLPFLQPIQKPVHIQEYAGRRVAVDGHAWLHRGAFGCATALALGQPTDSYVQFFMKMIGCLIFYNVIPIIVFDGEKLPMKAITNNARHEHRMEKLEEGKQHHRKGQIEKAEKCFQQAVNITQKMVTEVIKALDQKNIQHIVAPYEADPQLTYLVKTDQADAVITEDSDLLVFGCPKIITKMKIDGSGIAITHADIFTLPKLLMNSFDENMFRWMCMLSGCDYLPALRPCLNLKNTRLIVRAHKTLDKILERIKIGAQADHYGNYLKEFKKAEAAFLYPYVFDITSRTYIHLNPLPADYDIKNLSMLGLSPQNRDIGILRSNNAIKIYPSRDKLDANKENIDPFSSSQDEFKEFEFNDTELEQVSALLDKHEKSLSVYNKFKPVASTSNAAALATEPTNVIASKSTNVPAVKHTKQSPTFTNRNALAAKSMNTSHMNENKYTSNALVAKSINTNALRAESSNTNNAIASKSVNTNATASKSINANALASTSVHTNAHEAKPSNAHESKSVNASEPKRVVFEDQALSAYSSRLTLGKIKKADRKAVREWKPSEIKAYAERRLAFVRHAEEVSHRKPAASTSANVSGSKSPKAKTSSSSNDFFGAPSSTHVAETKCAEVPSSKVTDVSVIKSTHVLVSNSTNVPASKFIHVSGSKFTKDVAASTSTNSALYTKSANIDDVHGAQSNIADPLLGTQSNNMNGLLGTQSTEVDFTPLTQLPYPNNAIDTKSTNVNDKLGVYGDDILGSQSFDFDFIPCTQLPNSNNDVLGFQSSDIDFTPCTQLPNPNNVMDSNSTNINDGLGVYGNNTISLGTKRSIEVEADIEEVANSQPKKLKPTTSNHVEEYNHTLLSRLEADMKETIEDLYSLPLECFQPRIPKTEPNFFEERDNLQELIGDDIEEILNSPVEPIITTHHHHVEEIDSNSRDIDLEQLGYDSQFEAINVNNASQFVNTCTDNGPGVNSIISHGTKRAREFESWLDDYHHNNNNNIKRRLTVNNGNTDSPIPSPPASPIRSHKMGSYEMAILIDKASIGDEKAKKERDVQTGKEYKKKITDLNLIGIF